jgi:hypothetical protein
LCFRMPDGRGVVSIHSTMNRIMKSHHFLVVEL